MDINSFVKIVPSKQRITSKLDLETYIFIHIYFVSALLATKERRKFQPLGPSCVKILMS